MASENAKGSKESILTIEGLEKNFGGLKAVANLSLAVMKGELKGLIGPNGAGKTTVFNLITGFYKPNRGKVIFKGQDITGETPDRIVNRGIGRTFQKIRMMEHTKVIDAIKTAYFRHMSYNFIDMLFHTTRYNREEKQVEKKAREILDLLGISHFASKLGSDLSYGQQRKVSIARALALEPELLLLDEPTAGLNPGETDELVDLILQIKENLDLTIILVEHDMRVIMGICDSIIAMNEGAVIAEGAPEDIQAEERVIEAYLGSEV